MTKSTVLGMQAPCGNWNDHQSMIEARPEYCGSPIDISVDQLSGLFGYTAAQVIALIRDYDLDVSLVNGQTRVTLESARTLIGELRSKASTVPCPTVRC